MEKDLHFPAPDELVALGKITRTQGHAGAVRLLPFFSPADLIEELKTPHVYVVHQADRGNHKPTVQRLSISSLWYHKQFVILSFDEIQDMNAAEGLRDLTLFTLRENLWELGEGEYFAYELIGMKVIAEDGNELGEVVAVEDGPAHDYLRVRTESKEFLVPFVLAMIRAIDKSERRIVVSLPEGLTEL